ncbi:two-component system sensor histidine kinase EnvZ [Alteromonas sp. 5E99-2]|uniref:two-component system sensor histidine kinase EnvZ n=1 Tax=Alteromonas sp. 5E99-2 TaxID=2817683 RepID=UPI001A998877|nr:two-component system sensor histidine kinase EnvZ [Alteromonas sp. 5E99-2]
MRFLPRSAFGQTVLLIGVLLLINQVVSYLSVTYYFIKPSYQQINSLIATHISILEDTGILTRGDAEEEVFVGASKIRIVSESNALEEGLGNAINYEFMSAQIGNQLGYNADVRIGSGIGEAQKSPFIVWILLSEYPDKWISIPIYGLDETSLSPLTMYLMVIGFLSVVGGWAFVRHLNRPLQALQKAAKEVGKGQFPPPLEEQGTTESILVTRAFNSMNKGIQQLEHDRTLMTAGISHDLRTPLTRIRLASEMLPDDQEWIRDGIIHDIEDMNAIIDQCINYARVDQHTEVEKANLNSLINDIVQARKLEANHEIELDLKPLPLTLLRKVAIKRVLDNLVENAFKYGSDKITVRSYFDETESTLVCEVRDFGDGIKEESLDAMFMPFAQGDAARGGAGSGLGLAITKRIIDKHNGKIKLLNHAEKGLVARVTLPQR